MRGTTRTAVLVLVMTLLSFARVAGSDTAAIVANHDSTDIDAMPTAWVEKAKTDLHIAYGHTSHGAQLIGGLTGLVSFKGPLYAIGAARRGLDLRDRPFRGANDLGNPNRTAWAAATRTYLAANPEVNVVMWSWCGQAAAPIADIDTYLDLMEGLIGEYPAVRFVFMTGHLTGDGPKGRLHLANEHIRSHCRERGRILYDFADIESFDPEGRAYLDRLADDACRYDSNGDGRRDANWAREWQDAHEKGVDWYECQSPHNTPLNASRKAYAAWWLFARLAGWDGVATGDDGAGSDRVLFEEGFEDDRLTERGWYDGAPPRIARDASHSGRGAIEYEWTDGSDRVQGSSTVRHLFEPTDEVFLRFYLRLSKDWGWSGKPYHPHLTHFMTNANDRWRGPASSHLTLYVEPVNGRLRLAAQDIENADRPHGLTQGPLRGGYNGRHWESKRVLFDDDEWHSVEASFRLNTLDVEADRPNADGVVRGWFDGKLVIEETDVVLRSTDFPDMRFNQFLLAPYFGPGLLPHAQKLWIDDLAVGTQRLGSAQAR